MKAVLLVLAVLIPSLIQARQANGVVSGRLLSPDGTAAVGVRVAAMPVAVEGRSDDASEDLTNLTVTDSTGQFRLDGLSPGRYRIVAGSLYLPTFYPGKIQRSDATILTVRQNAVVNAIDFPIMVPEGVNVRGRISFLNDRADPTVRITRPDSSVFQEIPLHPDGSFEVRHVPPGPYTLRVSGIPSVDVTVPDKGLWNFEAKFPAMVQVMARFSVDGGGTPPLISLSFKSAGRTFSLGSSNSALGFIFPEGDYTMSPPSLPIGYAVKALTLDGNPVTADRLKFLAAADDRDLELHMILTAPPATK
jgi:hypothetical protein